MLGAKDEASRERNDLPWHIPLLQRSEKDALAICLAGTGAAKRATTRLTAVAEAIGGARHSPIKQSALQVAPSSGSASVRELIVAGQHRNVLRFDCDGPRLLRRSPGRM